MPREHVLTELDVPFAQLKGEPVMPWHVEDALDKLSHIWSLPPEEVELNIYRNLRNLLTKHSGEPSASPHP